MGKDEAYRSVEKMVYKLAHDFQRKFGGEWDEIMGEANLACAVAINTHDPSRSKLTTWTWHCVFNRLRDFLGKRIKHAREKTGMSRSFRRPGCEEYKGLRLDADFLTEVEARQPSGLSRLISELGEDAETVVSLALESDGRGVKGKRADLVEFLSDLGWAGGRMLETFEEIREVIR